MARWNECGNPANINFDEAVSNDNYSSSASGMRFPEGGVRKAWRSKGLWPGPAVVLGSRDGEYSSGKPSKIGENVLAPGLFAKKEKP
jgi:hypothetical protein